jgi:hypothetical protein
MVCLQPYLSNTYLLVCRVSIKFELNEANDRLWRIMIGSQTGYVPRLRSMALYPPKRMDTAIK